MAENGEDSTSAPMTKLDWGEGRRRFLAIRPEIEAALREGVSGRKIWQEHEVRLGIGYRGFAKLVSRYIGDVLPVPSRPTTPRRSKAPTPPLAPSHRLADRPLSSDSVGPPRRRFVHNNAPTKEYVRDRLGLSDSDE